MFDDENHKVMQTWEMFLIMLCGIAMGLNISVAYFKGYLLILLGTLLLGTVIGLMIIWLILYIDKNSRDNIDK